jgi:hypothetical protein
MAKSKYHHKSTENIPRDKRKCTDVCCTVFYILATLAAIGCAGYGFANGDPSKIGQTYDVDGNACGKEAAANFPYLFFNNPQSDLSTNNACVKSCPESSSSSIECLTNSQVTNCGNLTPYESAVKDGHFCWPSATDTASTQTTEEIEKESAAAEKAAQDFINGWPSYVAAFFLAILITNLFFKMLEKCALTMIKIMIGLFFILILGVALLMFTIEGAEIVGIILLVVLLIVAIVIWCSWSRIVFAAKIIQATADYITDVGRIACIPIVMGIIFAVFYIFWIVSSIYLASTGESVRQEGSHIATIEYTDAEKGMQGFFWFYGIWTSILITHYEAFVLSTVAAIWYFAANRKKLGSPVSSALKWGITYHFGTLVFGSFILAVLTVIEQMLEQAERAQKQKQDNQLVMLILCLAKCCVKMIKSWVERITKHAYIETALWNSNFCQACKDSFNIIMSNLWQLGVLHGITALVMFCGKFFVALLVTGIGYGILKAVESVQNYTFGSYVIPLIINFIIGWVVSDFYFDIFDASTDALLHCALVDEIVNGDPVHLFPELKKALRAHPKYKPMQGGGYMGGGQIQMANMGKGGRAQNYSQGPAPNQQLPPLPGATAPPQPGPQQGYPPQQPGPQPGYPPRQQPGYPPQGYPPQQPGYPPQQQPGYPPQGYPPQQPGYPPQGYPPQQPGYPPQQPGYPPQGYPPQQPGYPPQQPGYPPR